MMRSIRRRGPATALLAVVAIFAMVALAAGPGAAASTELHNETHTVDNSTRSVHVEVMNTTNASTGNLTDVTATFYGIDANGTETLVDEFTFSASADETVEKSVDVDATAYEKYRVVVTGDSAELIDSYVLTEASGSGGAWIPSGDVAGIPIWFIGLVVLVVVGWLLMEEE